MRFLQRTAFCFFLTSSTSVYSADYQVIDLGLLTDGLFTKAWNINGSGPVVGETDTTVFFVSTWEY